MKRRRLPIATVAALEKIEERAAWVEAEYSAGRLSLEDAEELAHGLREVLALVVLRDSVRPVGRPKGRSNPRGKPGGMLAQYQSKKAETRGRKRLWPVGFDVVTYQAVTRRMDRDGLGVAAAVEALLRDTARVLGMRESRAMLDKKNIPALYYQGRAKAMEAAREEAEGC